MIRGITFSEQAFYSADFAHYQNFFLNRQNGITKGCEIEHDEKTVTIGTGYFIAHGRMMNVEEAEIVTAVQGFAEGYNRIVYEIDLSKENTIEQFNQGYIKVLQSEELVQEDLDADGQVYQMPFCHFQWNGTEISDFMIDAPTLILDNVFADVSKNFESVKKQLEKYIAEQKSDFNDYTSDKRAEIENWVVEQKADFDEYADGKKAEMDKAVSEAEALVDYLEADNFEKRAEYFNGILAVDKWDADTSTYSFEESYPSEQYNIQIYAAQNITGEQLEALGSALMVGNITANIYTAKGDIPTMDIPIIVKAVKKYGSIN